MKREKKKGLAIEFVLVLMLVTAVFGALIVTVAAQGTGYSEAYGVYLERKLFLDEIGALSERKYIGGESIDLGGYSGEGNAFGYTVSDDNAGTVTVEGNGNILLTVYYIQEGGAGGWRLEKYVYGEIEADGEVLSWKY